MLTSSTAIPHIAMTIATQLFKKPGLCSLMQNSRLLMHCSVPQRREYPSDLVGWHKSGILSVNYATEDRIFQFRSLLRSDFGQLSKNIVTTTLDISNKVLDIQMLERTGRTRSQWMRIRRWKKEGVTFRNQKQLLSLRGSPCSYACCCPAGDSGSWFWTYLRSASLAVDATSTISAAAGA